MTFHIIFLSTHSTGEHRAVHLVINLHSPPFMVVLRDIPANNVTHRPDHPKAPPYTRKHVVWATKRENWFSGSTWPRGREKAKDGTGQKKSQSGNFAYLGRISHSHCTD